MTSNNGLLTALVPVVVKDRGGVEFPSDEIFDVTGTSTMRMKVTLPEPARAIWIHFSSLSNPNKILYSAGFGGNFSSGDNFVDFDGTALADPFESELLRGHIGNKLTTGSYYIQLIYRPVWGDYDADQRVAVTKIEDEEIFQGELKRTFHGTPWGGPDSFAVSLPQAGLLYAHVGNARGKLLDGSWNLLRSGPQKIGFWNIDTSGALGVGDDSVLGIKWGFRKVRAALRVRGNTCGEWDGVSSHAVDGFYSQVTVPYYSSKPSCNWDDVKWVLRNRSLISSWEWWQNEVVSAIPLSEVGINVVSRTANYSIRRLSVEVKW